MVLLRSLTFVILLVTSTILISCSHSKSPVDPVFNDQSLVFVEGNCLNRTPLAVYDAEIDPGTGTFTVYPIQRSADYHFPITQLYPDVLEVIDYGFTPSFWADIKLTHPLPDSGISVYDPRVIAILPAYPGVRFVYPALGVGGNNAVLKDPDGYTPLFDGLGGSIPGNVNPFIAYFKINYYRIWSYSGNLSETRRWQMNLSGFGGPMQFKLVVDISTNYPEPSQKIIDNAQEPVEIEAFIDQGLMSSGGSARIEVTLLDWQGDADIRCMVECPQLFNDTIEIFSEGPGQNANEYVFSGMVLNELMAPEGEYDVLVAACDRPTGVCIFHETVAVVHDTIFDPVDVTPEWLQIWAKDVCMDSNYAYVLGNGLHVFDISDPLNPAWMDRVNGGGNKLLLSDGYAYSAGNGFRITDIDPLESAYIVKETVLPQFWHYIEFDISDGYAYAIRKNSSEPLEQICLDIIDVDPPESAYIVKSIISDELGSFVAVSDGYAYVTGYGLKIIDIDPPALASIVHTIPGMNGSDICISGNYAYVATLGLYIVDIEFPEEAYVLNTIDTGKIGREIEVLSDYVYIGDSEEGFQIIDIEPPESAHLVKSLDLSAEATGIDVIKGYAYVAEDTMGVQIIDVDPPESASIITKIETSTDSQGVSFAHGNAFVAAGFAGLQIMDVDPLESAYIIKTIDTPGSAWGVCVSDGYACIADRESGLQIIDITQPESAYIVAAVDTPEQAFEVCVSDGYACVVDPDFGLQIIDIDPPGLAHIVAVVDTPGTALDVDISNGYAFVADRESGIQIIDIDPPESAFIVKTVDTPGNASGIHISDGYAYVADEQSGLQIIDINPAESAYILKAVDTQGCASGVHVSNGFAYVVYRYSSFGMKIININPPESAYVVYTTDAVPSAKKINVVENYAYVCYSWTGLQILKLW